MDRWKIEIVGWNDDVQMVLNEGFPEVEATGYGTTKVLPRIVHDEARIRSILDHRLVKLRAIVQRYASTKTPLRQEDFISLKEAATRAYEETESTLVADFAEMSLPSGDKAVLGWYANALVGSKRLTPIFGKKPPSRVRRQIPADELKQCGFSDDALTLIPYGQKEPRFVDLEIKEADLVDRIKEIRSWSGFDDLPNEQTHVAVSVDRIPLIELCDVAATKGWDFGPKSLHIKDLTDAIRQAGIDGTLTLWGRPDRHMFESLTRDEPLNRIPPGHWKDHQIIYGYLDKIEDNFETKTQNMADTHRRDKGGFVDLHIERGSALLWLETEAEKFKGRSKMYGGNN